MGEKIGTEWVILDEERTEHRELRINAIVRFAVQPVIFKLKKEKEKKKHMGSLEELLIDWWYSG